ncbi:MAG TPA: hypothetical protein VKY19_07335 [Ktedonosporobacter sp.]|nr:hypothetical protein [Ktedonosporobacter sp.]
MDLLQVANTVNQEMVQLQRYYSYLLQKQDPMAIFNSIVTCLTEDLVDSIELRIHKCERPDDIVASWQYDMQDPRYPKRTGPTLEQIFTLLKNVPEGTACLSCYPHWSKHFLTMTKVAQRQALLYTIWAEDDEKAAEDVSSRTAAALAAIDLQPLEDDLRQLISIKLLDADKGRSIYDSARKSIGTQSIKGVQFSLDTAQPVKEAAEWELVLDASLKLVRIGTSREQALKILQAVRSTQEEAPHIKIKPILTSAFSKLPKNEQHDLMKDTYWASDFKKKGLFGFGG